MTAEQVQEVSITEIYSLALDTFGDNEVAAHWLGEERPCFGDKTALSLCLTPQGRYQVWVVLMRIQHGVYS